MLCLPRSARASSSPHAWTPWLVADALRAPGARGMRTCWPKLSSCIPPVDVSRRAVRTRPPWHADLLAEAFIPVFRPWMGAEALRAPGPRGMRTCWPSRSSRYSSRGWKPTRSARPSSRGMRSS